MSEPIPDPPKARRWPLRLAKALTAVLVFLGPWPVDDSGFEGSDYQSRTLDRLDASPPVALAGPIRVGLAEVDLTPTSPRPLAGFIGQIRTRYVGIDSPCLARALTIESGSGTLTILAADLLLINAKLARAICDRAEVRPDQVYFTSSHTHGGPGGWGDHPLEMLVAGAYDPAWFDDLANRFAGIVRRSRAELEPAEVGFIQVRTKGRQSNRVDRNAPTHDALSALIFRPVGASQEARPLAILTSFGAHATVSHPVPPRLGGDYPAALASELKRRTGARSVLFASGAVGDASPARPKAASQAASAEALGSSLADDLMAALPSARFEAIIPVGNLRVAVDLPPVRLPFLSRHLRFSPLATWWIADRRTHLHALRIGPAALIGFPGDYSGHLADRLVDLTRPSGVSIVATSFDGDYRGYLVSGSVFRDHPCYETRWMNFYGPWAGDYLNDIARRMVDRLADFPGKPARGRVDADLGSRIAIAILVGVSILSRRPRWSRELIGRIGWATVVVASLTLLGFEVDPGWVDWARFGIPAWSAILGPLIGAFSFSFMISRARPARAALLLGLACGLLSANWVVVLMVARGAIRSGFSDRPTPARSATTAI